eukprot:2191975-Amphidinium_carterae.1
MCIRDRSTHKCMLELQQLGSVAGALLQQPWPCINRLSGNTTVHTARGRSACAETLNNPLSYTYLQQDAK